MSDAVIAVDLGGTNLKAAVVDLAGNMVCSERTPTKAEEGAEAVCGRLVELCLRLRDGCRGGPHEIRAVGIGVPGPLDARRGLVLRCPNLPGWEGFAVAEVVSEGLGLEVHIENDANAAALAEAWVGAGSGCRNVVCLTLGTGVGCGIVAGGRILKGQGQGAELGHMIIREGGRLCGCGARGCLEAYASASAVAARAREALLNGGPAVRRSSLNGAELTCEAVFRAANDGDDLAVRIVSDTGRYLAAGLASVVHIFHPEVIVLTGGMIRAGEEAVLGPTRKFLSALAMRELLETVRIELSPLKDGAGILGAAAVAFNRSGRAVIDLD